MYNESNRIHIFQKQPITAQRQFCVPTIKSILGEKMLLTEIYKKGEAELKMRDIGWLLDGVETEFGKSSMKSPGS